MRVTFEKVAHGQCRWVAVRGKRTRVPCGAMGGHLRPGDLPHDLAQFVAERELGIERGFWGLVAAGATFRSTGRKRTKPGRELIARHRADLADAEHRAGTLVAAWRAGEPCLALDAVAAEWADLRQGETLSLEWPARASARTRGG